MLNKKVIINTEIGEKQFAIDKVVNKYSKGTIHEYFDNSGTCRITFILRTYAYKSFMAELAELLLVQN